MKKLIIVLAGLLILWCVYKVYTFFLFLRLKNKLKEGDINTFTNILGDNYQYRFLSNGLIRYKWSMKWMTVKANFDETGKVVYTEVKPVILFTIKSEMLFNYKP